MAANLQNSRFGLRDFYTLLLPESDCLLISISPAMLAMLRSVATEMQDSGLIYDEVSPTGDVSLSPVGYSVLHDTIGEFLAMSDCPLSLVDLLDVLSDIRDNLSTMAGRADCGCSGSGTGGAGTFPAQVTTEDVVPPGFTDGEAYAIYKCKAATKIYNDLLLDMTMLSTFSVVGLLVVEISPLLIIALSTPVPFDDVVVIALLLIQLLLITAQWADALIALDGAREDVICAMVSAQSSLDAVTAVEAIMGVAIGPYSIIDDIANTLITIDAMNALFIKIPSVSAMAAQSCGDCGACPEIGFATSVPTAVGDIYTIPSFGTGPYYVNVCFWRDDAGQSCGSPVSFLGDIRIVSSTGRTGAFGGKAYRIANVVPFANHTGNLYNSDTAPNPATVYPNARSVVIKSNTAFTAVIELVANG